MTGCGTCSIRVDLNHETQEDQNQSPLFMSTNNDNHFNQKQVRKAEFIKPPNTLKAKVGEGGLSEHILAKAQAVIEENSVDFLPIGQKHLSALHEGIKTAEAQRGNIDPETLISAILYPAMQLKANGGMFHYPLVSVVAGRLIQFLEVIHELDDASMEIVDGFYTALRALVVGQVKGDGGKSGAELYDALNEACYRYFLHKP